MAAVLQHVGGDLSTVEVEDEVGQDANLQAECQRLRGRVAQLESNEMKRAE